MSQPMSIINTRKSRLTGFRQKKVRQIGQFSRYGHLSLDENAGICDAVEWNKKKKYDEMGCSQGHWEIMCFSMAKEEMNACSNAYYIFKLRIQCIWLVTISVLFFIIRTK